MTHIIPPDLGVITTDMTIDQVMEVKDRLDTAKRLVREADAMMKRALIDYINEHGAFEFGGIRYYVGSRKKTTCVNVPAAVESILQHVGGDFHAFCDLLAAQPIKHGAARGVLGEDWDIHFTTEVVPDVKTGLPTKEIKTLPTSHQPKGTSP
jgi:hypothetical protein